MRNRYVLIIDLLTIPLCVLGAFVLRLDWRFFQALEYERPFWLFLLSALAVKPLVYAGFGLYRRYWRYASTPELTALLLGVSAATMVMGAVTAIALLTQVIGTFPRSILAIDWLLSLATVAGARLSIRLLAESFHTAETTHPSRRVLIAGAGQAGVMVLQETRRNPQLGYDIVGLVDDSPAKIGKEIHGVRVLGPLSALGDVIASHRVQEVIVAMPTAPGAVVRRLTDVGRQAGVRVQALPGVFELLDGGVSVNRLRTVDIADLLRRRQIVADPQTARYLEGQVVLVTGAGGSIGSELCRQIARAHVATLVLVGHGENSIFEVANQLTYHFPAVRVVPVIADVRDAESLRRVFRAHRPAVVFHAAAHKHVPLMEAHPQEAITNNVVGTQVLVAAALEAEVERFVLVSTDKAVAPSNVMGASKKLAEMIVRDAARRSGRRFIAVRFGNVLGSRGSVVPYFRKQIEAGGPVTVTHPEMTRFFMTIPEAVYLVLKAGGFAHGGELFVLNMGDPVRIVDLAHDLIRLSGGRDDVQVVFTGLRPGEKLSEELWEPDSRIEPVGDGDVFRVVEPSPLLEGERLTGTIAVLQAAAARGDVLAIHHHLSEAIPSFVSSLHATEPAPR